ncbi:MAG: UDP-N-acetylglucosamine--N-acetylmuramyl-(pentapeptide) pyrophosphoryl-undecaprenol N-acetylglucosamine transferase [Clostridia bacterium]|nr:UDP-N-acetylglucosamine--N-acetylmuramyl-(pentapeptide) pyrophosphoryl-undecaprenol N-acetylglucosamine transferase [Clostridia bacterium]
MLKIVLTGGGTAGHIIPNVSLLPYLKEKFDKIYYIGSDTGLEKDIITKEGVEFYSTPSVKFKRGLKFDNIFIPFKLISCIKKAGKILDNLSPNVIFSKGGYVSLPTVIAAKKRNIPVISHESDLSIGLSNKIAIPFSKQVLTSFKETALKIKNGKFVGPPLREFKNYSIKYAQSFFGFENNKPTLLIMGGSLGAKAINDNVLPILNDILQDFNVIHLTGKGNKVNFSKNGYYQTEYLKEMDVAYSISNICITRAGSNALFELLYRKIPCLVIPLPKGNSRGDQIKNAEYFSYKGVIKTLYQQNIKPSVLYNQIKQVYSEKTKYENALNNFHVENSCPKIAEILYSLARKHKEFL